MLPACLIMKLLGDTTGDERETQFFFYKVLYYVASGDTQSYQSHKHAQKPYATSKDYHTGFTPSYYTKAKSKTSDIRSACGEKN